jgi:hypothetical protein
MCERHRWSIFRKSGPYLGFTRDRQLMSPKSVTADLGGGFPQKMRPLKKLERVSDSTRSKRALECARLPAESRAYAGR